MPRSLHRIEAGSSGQSRRGIEVFECRDFDPARSIAALAAAQRDIRPSVTATLAGRPHRPAHATRVPCRCEPGGVSDSHFRDQVSVCGALPSPAASGGRPTRVGG